MMPSLKNRRLNNMDIVDFEGLEEGDRTRSVV